MLSVLTAEENAQTSLPVRGAWVEMENRVSIIGTHGGSLPVRGAWVEISLSSSCSHQRMSLPVRGAWVEILLPVMARMTTRVAPRAGSVG